MMLSFGTKAETLQRAGPVVTVGKVLPCHVFSVGDWSADARSIMSALDEKGWLRIPLIVRSSALNEDTHGQSLAGHFDSVEKVEGPAAMVAAVACVIQSYGKNQNSDDQLLIQPMLSDLVMSGVVFSKDPSTGANYYVINYDDISGLANTVTGGTSGETKCYFCADPSRADLPPRLKRVIDLTDELKLLFGHEALDIEFAFDSQDELYLLQVRPLILTVASSVSLPAHILALEKIENKIRQLACRHPYLHGATTYFGVMPDWNPAEIIGVRPKPLALSLYKELVTDSIWAYQRSNYGYKNLRSFPLLFSFAGIPYIDIRVSFNSFLPADLDGTLSDKLVDYYLDRLAAKPSNHDKVEFEVVFSCYTMDLPERLEALTEHGFDADEIEVLGASLRGLTNRIINNENGHWQLDLKKIAELSRRQHTLLASGLDSVSKIYWLLEDCKRYGTLPFAGLARAGFIAVQMLRSLVGVGVLSPQEYERFMKELDTVGSAMTHDYETLGRGEFLGKYGHLRPGTYDILSSRYDETPDEYFDWNGRRGRRKKAATIDTAFRLSLDQYRVTEALLKKHNIEQDVLGLFDYIKGAIEGREYAKFVFTKSLSDALQLLEALAKECGFTREDASFVDIGVIYQLYSSSADVASGLERAIHDGRRRYQLTTSINLPPLILRPNDVYGYTLPKCEPNFVTLKTARGSVRQIHEERRSLKGSILFIPNADPGYDWIFARGIAGFVTMYGGTNSHMAIRANELGIPAVIGAGESLFKKWLKGNVIELDCAGKRVVTIK